MRKRKIKAISLEMPNKVESRPITQVTRPSRSFKKLLQTSLSGAEFEADLGTDLHFEARGCKPEHKHCFSGPLIED